MPAGFESCVRRGGRVRRVSGPNKRMGLKAGEYVNVCVLKGEMHRGELHMSKGAMERAVG